MVYIPHVSYKKTSLTRWKTYGEGYSGMRGEVFSGFETATRNRVAIEDRLDVYRVSIVGCES
jgi:hypothetical protein